MANGLVGKRGDPEPPDGQPAAGKLIHVAKDELALAASVAGVDHLGKALVGEQPAHLVELFARTQHRPQLELRGDHGQRVESPSLPAAVVAGRLFQLDQMAHAPGDHAVLAVKAVLACRPHP